MNAVTDAKYLQQPLPATIANAAAPQFDQIEVHFDRETRSAWTYLNPQGAACFNMRLLNDLRARDKAFEANRGHAYWKGDVFPIDFSVLASKSKHVFSWGGDLGLFVVLIRSRDRDALLSYANACIDCVYGRLRHYGSPTTTISLIQGDALGGGFEYALSSDVIIAEETAQMGFPEILFNLFPGMGAYSLLARRLGAPTAEKMLLSGDTYSAAHLHALGIVDIVTPAGQAAQAAYDFMRRSRKQLNGMRAIHRCRELVNAPTREELDAVVNMWVDSALRLQERDLKMMGRIVRAQLRQHQLRYTGLDAASKMADCDMPPV